MLEITIRDNGSGIDENTKDKIFAPFFTTKDNGEANKRRALPMP